MDKDDDAKLTWIRCRTVGTGRTGGAIPPDFGRSVNPIQTKGGGILCPPYYWLPTQIFRPSYGPALQQEMIFPLSCLRDSTRSKPIQTRPSQSNTSVDMSAVIARLARVTSWNMDVWRKIYILIRIVVLSGCPESRPINHFLWFNITWARVNQN